MAQLSTAQHSTADSCVVSLSQGCGCTNLIMQMACSYRALVTPGSCVHEVTVWGSENAVGPARCVCWRCQHRPPCQHN